MHLDPNILQLTESSYSDDFNVIKVKEKNKYVISHKKYDLWELSFIMNKDDETKKVRSNTNIISTQVYTSDTKNDFYNKLNNFIINNFFNDPDIFNDKYTFKDSFFDLLNSLTMKKQYLLNSSVVVEKNDRYINFFNYYNNNTDIKLKLVLNDINSFDDSIINFKKSIIVE